MEECTFAFYNSPVMGAMTPSSIGQWRVWRHDLQNQLAVIDGLSALLLEDSGPNAREREDLHTIRSAAQRALALVRDAKLPED